MFDEHIKQGIDISNPLTQPHQMYLEIVQQQQSNTRTSATPYTVDKVESTDIDQGITESSKNDNQQRQLDNKESTSVIKRWSEPVNLPKTQRSMDCNNAELPSKTTSPSKSMSRIIEQTVVKPHSWIPVERRQ